MNTQLMRKANFVIRVHCEACGEVHVVNFCSREEFERLRCKESNAPLFCTRQRYKKVFTEVVQDVMRYSIAV